MPNTNRTKTNKNKRKPYKTMRNPKQKQKLRVSRWQTIVVERCYTAICHLIPSPNSLIKCDPRMLQSLYKTRQPYSASDECTLVEMARDGLGVLTRLHPPHPLISGYSLPLGCTTNILNSFSFKL